MAWWISLAVLPSIGFVFGAMWGARRRDLEDARQRHGDGHHAQR
jgi:hypothetical protein